MRSEHGIRLPLGKVSGSWKLFRANAERSSDYTIKLLPASTDMHATGQKFRSKRRADDLADFLRSREGHQ